MHRIDGSRRTTGSAIKGASGRADVFLAPVTRRPFAPESLRDPGRMIGIECDPAGFTPLPAGATAMTRKRLEQG